MFSLKDDDTYCLTVTMFQFRGGWNIAAYDDLRFTYVTNIQKNINFDFL